MPTITSSAHLTIAAGRTPGSVVISVHGRLDIAAVASLDEALRRTSDGRDAPIIRIDLQHVRGVDAAGVAELATVAEQVDQAGTQLTLCNPSELLCEALERQGLTGRIRMGDHDWRPARLPNSVERGRARTQHPAGHLLRP
jgi:anti-anti-sigma factor